MTASDSAERIGARKIRRRQLTDAGKVEITGRSPGSKKPGRPAHSMDQNGGVNGCRPEHLFGERYPTRAPALTLWTDRDITVRAYLLRLPNDRMSRLGWVSRSTGARRGIKIRRPPSARASKVRDRLNRDRNGSCAGGRSSDHAARGGRGHSRWGSRRDALRRAGISKSILRKARNSAPGWHRIGLPQSTAGQAGRSFTKQWGCPWSSTAWPLLVLRPWGSLLWARLGQPAPTESGARFAITCKQGCPKQVVTACR